MQISVETALTYLEERGFVNKKQNLRLLKKANFNPELVANFLNAKKTLQTATNPDDSKISNKQFGIRHKLAKQTQPELYAKFIEAKKALHSSDASEEESKSNGKRCYLTKEERIARKEQRLKLQQAAKKEEEVEAEDTPVIHPICPLLPPSPTVNVKEEEQPKKSCLRREERIAFKLQRIQEKVAKNKEDLQLKTQDNDANTTIPSASEEEFPKHGRRLSKEERLARKESRLKLKLLKLSENSNIDANNNNTNESKEEEDIIEPVVQQQQRQHRRFGNPLSKEERLARKEERLKMKEARLKMKEQRLAKLRVYHIPARVSTIFIDGSSISKTMDEIADMAKNIVENNPHLVKVTILYEGVDIASISTEKMVIASATPLFESVQDAVKILSSRIEDKKTFSVISGNKEWIQNLRNEGISALITV